MRSKSGLFVVALAATALLAMTPMALLADKGMAQEKGKDMEHMNEGKEVTLEGEVLDLYCFMNHPETAQGMDHAKCASSCIKKGLPIGFMSNGEVYLIVGKDHESAADMVAGLAGQKSRIKGTLLMHNGVKAIDIESIEKL
jgi:hypothetical protein